MEEKNRKAGTGEIYGGLVSLRCMCDCGVRSEKWGPRAG